MFNPRKNKKFSYILDLIVTVICVWILPNYILKDHQFLAIVVGIIVAVVINSFIGGYWRFWKQIR
jgi:putative flippase GtrA